MPVMKRATAAWQIPRTLTSVGVASGKLVPHRMRHTGSTVHTPSVSNNAPSDTSTAPTASTPAPPHNLPPHKAQPQPTQAEQALPDEEYTIEYVTETATDEEETEEAASVAAAPAAQPQQETASTAQTPQPQSQKATSPSKQQMASVSTSSAGMAFMITAQTPLSPAMQTSVGGWVVAFALLLGVRLSREEADRERLDLRALQVRQNESRVQSAELRTLRRTYLEQERIRKEQEAAKRLEEARKKSEEEALARAAREAAYRDEAAKETARLWADQQAAREAFLAAEAKLAEELTKRTAMEVAIREQEVARKKEEEEKARVAYELQQQRLALEAARRAEEQRQREEEEKALKAERRRRLRCAQTRYCLTLDGTVTVQQAPPGTFTTQSTQPGWQRGPQLARLDLSVSLGFAGRACCFLPADPSGQGKPSQDAMSGRTRSLSSAIGAQFGLGAQTGAAAEVGRQLGWQLDQQGGEGSELLTAERRMAFESAAAAVEGATEITSALSNSLLPGLWQHLAASAPLGQPGVLDKALPGRAAEMMSKLELTHWRRISACRCDVALKRAIAQVAPLAERQPLEQPFQVHTLRAVLPLGHPERGDAKMQRAVDALKAGSLEKVVEAIEQVVEEEVEQQQAIHQLPDAWPHAPAGADQPADLPPLTLTCLTYAWFLDVVGYSSSSSSSSGGGRTDSSNTSHTSNAGGINSITDSREGASTTANSNSDVQAGKQAGLVQQVIQLASYQLRQAGNRVEADGLTPTAACIKVALGGDHPLTDTMNRLAEVNLSATSKLRAESRKQQAELEIASALLRAQDPSSGQWIDPNNPVVRQALIPVPERLWAIRNTASNLVRFGDPSQATEAIGSLQGACDLCSSHYGSSHPSCMGVLLDTRDALLVALARSGGDDESQVDRLMSGLDDVNRSLAETIQAIAERFLVAQDVLSVVILLEAAAKELSTGPGHPPASVSALQRQASGLLYQLAPKEARVVMEKRNSKGSSILRSLAREFTEELGVYSSSRKGRLEQWRQGAPMTPLR